MTELKQFDITSWGKKRLVRFLKCNKVDVVLVGEENIYFILPNKKVVIEVMNVRYQGPNFYRYSIVDFIKDLKGDFES